MQHFYLPPLKINFSENEPLKIQIMRVGSFYDERYGKVEITTQHLIAMMENFNNKVRGVDIALDFSHETSGPAAGWIKRIELSQDQQEMWAEVDWTNAGKENLLGKEYRYVSPDFTFSYKDNETLQEFGAVLLGAGLTNRPVIKGMAPAISLSEYKEIKQGEKTMTPEEMKAALVAKDAEISALKEKLAALEAAKSSMKPKEEEEGVDMADDKMKEKSEDKAKILALESKLKEKEAVIEMAEKSKKFDIMLSEGKAVEAQRDAFLSGDMTAFVEKAMPVKLSEIGSGGQGTTTDGKETGTDKVMKLAEEHKAKGKTLPEAIQIVLRSNPEVRAQYELENKV